MSPTIDAPSTTSKPRRYDAAPLVVDVPLVDLPTRKADPFSDDQLQELARLLLDGATSDHLGWLIDELHAEQHRRSPLRHLYGIHRGASEYPSLCWKVWTSAFETTAEGVDRKLLQPNDCPECCEIAIEHDIRIVRRVDA